jgi:YD repeat-containing protein
MVKEIHSVLINSSDLRTFVSENEYDVWGRIQKMIYPDGETVNYQYNAAGNLRSMYSEKDSRQYEIIKQLGYNEDEQRVFKLLGNGTKTTYSYEPERKRLATMTAGKGNTKLFDNQYTYDKVDNVLSIENNAVIPIIGLGGKTSNFYRYDEWNRLISANGRVETKNHKGSYTLDMQYDKLYNIIRKNQVDSVTNSKTQDWTYKYEDENHPNAPSSIGSKKYEYDANGNPTVVNDSLTGDYRRMIWDEENRLMLLSDNGNGNNYVYDHAGERVIKCQSGVQSVYIDGLQAGMLQNTRNYTAYVSAGFVVKNDGFTKHYYAGAERVLSKLGTGEFNNKFTATNKVLTAGNRNYIQRQQQLQAGLEAQYKELAIPPGNPTQKANLGQPENTGQPPPAIMIYLAAGPVSRSLTRKAMCRVLRYSLERR